jgi:hypothetical protein
MSDYYDYSFEEAKVTYKGKTGFGYGSFCVEYTVDDAQADCGYAGGVDIVNCTDLVIGIEFEDGEWVDVTDKAELTELLKPVVNQIDGASICEEIEGSF